VDKLTEIPMDYDGYMVVPITFMDKYNPEQFEIIDALNRYIDCDYFGVNEDVQKRHSHCCNINGVAVYKRIVIRKKAGVNNG
jgi:site-specific DNA-methyltransferase (adenine-specific)